MERLQKVIAASGLTSRRKAEVLISEGRVRVNGNVIREMGYKVKKGDRIEVDGELIQKENKVYYVMNKPKKCLCTLDDEHGRKTVVSLIDCEERIFPVGRLDYDTSGVLILTNDGEFANMIIHPRYHLPKTYDVLIDGILDTSQIKELEKGIQLDDGMTLPAKVRVRKKDYALKKTKFDLTIVEGRNHQVKRMVEYFGYQVTSLHRKSIGFLKVDDMSQGSYRLLKPQEVKDLRRLANEGK
ncbi:pseudouridine synthase [uncultured Traorella sp.]|jgi:23S rRNA pseudouridine2605 synthase|uniref:pseudouridine synthase n=1 Tax=uncultured Traorella sp. TaxID=1929048 RepID=UPI0025F1E9A8|nr:pseudouridine synthase [uncultured Traorella sp.]